MSKRLFFALWPDSEIREKCIAIATRLQHAGRLVHPDNIHITLVFLGGVDVPTETKLLAALSSVRFAPLAIKFDTLSFWRRPRIICLTGKPENDAITTLIDQLNAIVASCGIPIDDRPYQAHVTLLRKASHLPPLTFEPIIWQTGSFCLVESCSTPEGVVYRVLKTWHSQPDVASGLPGNETSMTD